MVSNKLVIISIPFQRLIRTHLSPELVKIFSTDSDLLIVSPFANELGFADQYVNSRIHVIKSPSVVDLSWLNTKFLAISNILRWQGYWFRRRNDIPYYWATRKMIFCENGNDKKNGILKQIGIDFLSFLGGFSNTWKLFDFIHGNWTYSFPELFTFTSKYNSIIFVQASTWGYQDDVLGYWARKKKWKSILLPYTTDQLFCNGWLYCEYNKIFVQGNSEYLFAKKFHFVPDERIVFLGSINDFFYRKLLSQISKESNKINKECFTILYAGSSSMFFPLEDEFTCLELLLEYAEKNLLENINFVYRPLGENEFVREKIISRFSSRKNLVIKFADQSIFELDNFHSFDWESTMSKHILSLLGSDLVLTAGVTSLSLDCAYLGIPSIVLNIHSTDFYVKRRLGLMLDKDNRIRLMKSVPHISELNLLLPKLKSIIKDDKERKNILNGTMNDWGYYNPNFLETIVKNLFH